MPDFADHVDHVNHVFAALFHQFEIFFGVFFGKRNPGHNFGAAAVHFQGPDRGGQNRNMGFEAAETAFDVPEFFKTDIGGKTGFGDMVVEQLQADAVGDDGRLPHGDVGKRAGMHHAGIVFRRAHHGGVDGVAHEGGHGVADFQITGGNRFAAFVESHGDIVEPFFQIGQVPDNRQNRHTLGPHGNTESGLHGKAVHAAAKADDDVSQRLGAEIDNPAQLHAGRIDVEAPHAGQPLQLFVVVVAFMLHAGGQGHHGQVVGVHDVIDIAGQSQRKFGHGDQQ